MMGKANWQVSEWDMERARFAAWKSTITQALAQKAREGEQEWASAVLKRADAAALNVRAEDLTVARVNR